MALLNGPSDTSGWLRLFVRALAFGAVPLLLLTLWRGFQARMTIRRLKAMGIPIIPHSLLLGHLPVIARLLRGKPADLHVNYIPQLIFENWRDLFPGETEPPGAVYLDMWPLGPPTLLTMRPGMAAQFMAEASLPRPSSAQDFLRPLTGGTDLVSSTGAQWKVWRSRLNPGFSARNVTAMVPAMLDEVLVFVDNLRRRTGTGGQWGQVFPLENPATDLTIDIIGRAVLDIKLHEQTSGPSVFRKALIENLNLCAWGFNAVVFFKWINPVRHYILWRNTRIMKNFLLPKIHEKIRAAKKNDAGSSHHHHHPDDQSTPEKRPASSGGGGGGGVQKTVVDLALKEYFNEETETGTTSSTTKGRRTLADPSPAFVDDVVAQLKIFMFAGHDTTATTICWVLFMLEQHPEALARLRAEHDAVLGASVSTSSVASQLRTAPHLLLGSAFPWTTAVIRETLRVWPVVGATRDGVPGLFLTEEGSGSGIRHPTEGFMLWDAIRAAAILGDEYQNGWHRPRDFVPERWLATASENSVFYPPPNGFRSFGLGPRNCIGQELAMAELKLVLILVARELDWHVSYDAWDVASGRSAGPPQRDTVEGKRYYQSGSGTAHPKDGMPMMVRLRGGQGTGNIS